MFILIIIAVALYMAYSSKVAGPLFKTFSKMSLYSKMVFFTLVLGAFSLFFPDVLPSLVSTVIGCALILTIPWQVYRIYRAGRVAGSYFPRPTRLLPLCALLVLMTPLGDFILARDYPRQGAVLIAALAIAYNCLYLIEIYIRYPLLEGKDPAPTLKG